MAVGCVAFAGAPQKTGDAAKGKRRVLQLTEAGLGVHRRLQRQKSQLANKLIAGLSTQELTQLNKLLAKLKTPLLE